MGTLPELHAEDVRAIERALHDLLAKAEASAALVIDKGGFIITQCGDYDDFDTVSLGALSAASFAATKSIAGLVCETNFTSVYQQGETNSLLILNIDEHSLLTVVFKASISVGAVKYYAAGTVGRIAEQMKIAKARSPDKGIDLALLNVADTTEVFQKKKGKKKNAA